MELDRAQRVMLFKFCAYGFLKNLRFFEPFLYLFFLAKGLSYTQIGILIGVQAITVYVLEIPTGIIADLTGRRRAMVLAFASYLVSFAIFSATSSFWLFAVAMVLFGAGEAFRSGTHKSMIMQHLDIEGLSDLKVHYYGTTRSVSRLGSAASILIAGTIVYLSGGYHLVFAASMVPYVFGLLLMLTYPAELDGQWSKRSSAGSMVRHMVDSFKTIRANRELDKLLVNGAVFESFFKVAKDYLQPILKQAALALPVLAAIGVKKGGEAAVLITPVYFAIYINEFVSSRWSGRLADRVGNLAKSLNWLFWALAGGFVLAGVFLKLSLMPVTVVLVFVFYTLNNLRKPAVIGFLSDQVEPKQRATILSVEAQTIAIVQAAVAPLLGLIADRLSIPYVFIIGGAVLVAAGVPLQLGRSSRERTAEAASAVPKEEP